MFTMLHQDVTDPTTEYYTNIINCKLNKIYDAVLHRFGPMLTPNAIKKTSKH